MDKTYKPKGLKSYKLATPETTYDKQFRKYFEKKIAEKTYKPKGLRNNGFVGRNLPYSKMFKTYFESKCVKKTYEPFGIWPGYQLVPLAVPYDIVFKRFMNGKTPGETPAPLSTLDLEPSAQKVPYDIQYKNFCLYEIQDRGFFDIGTRKKEYGSTDLRVKKREYEYYNVEKKEERNRFISYLKTAPLTFLCSSVITRIENTEYKEELLRSLTKDINMLIKRYRFFEFLDKRVFKVKHEGANYVELLRAFIDSYKDPYDSEKVVNLAKKIPMRFRSEILYFAYGSFSGLKGLVEKHLELKLNLNARLKIGRNPRKTFAQMAFQDNNSGVISLLKKAKVDMSYAFIHAVITRNIELLKKYIKLGLGKIDGIYWNKGIPLQLTPLQIGVQRRYTKIAIELINAGASIKKIYSGTLISEHPRQFLTHISIIDFCRRTGQTEVLRAIRAKYGYVG